MTGATVEAPIGGCASKFILMIVGSIQFLTDCWLEASVSYNVGLSIGIPKPAVASIRVREGEIKREAHLSTT